MQKIRIDFDNPGLPQHISAVENDSQSRFFQATLYENGKAYIAPEGATYSIMYRGFGPQNQGWYDTINDGAGKRAACAVSGNVVTCEIARQALQVPGHVSIVLCVTTGKGYMLKSWPIECDCKNDRYDSTAEIQSFFYITQVTNADWTQAIQAWENLKDTIDPTLSVSGKAADAAKVGTALADETTRAKAAEETNAQGIGKLKEDTRLIGLEALVFVDEKISTNKDFTVQPSSYSEAPIKITAKNLSNSAGYVTVNLYDSASNLLNTETALLNPNGEYKLNWTAKRVAKYTVENKNKIDIHFTVNQQLFEYVLSSQVKKEQFILAGDYNSVDDIPRNTISAFTGKAGGLPSDFITDGIITKISLKDHSWNTHEKTILFDEYNGGLYIKGTGTWQGYGRKTLLVGAGRKIESFTKALEIANELGNCDVYVDAGTYDLVKEIGEDNLSSYIFDNASGHGPYIGNGTRLFMAAGAKVVCNYTGTDRTVHRDFAILNVCYYPFKGDFEIYGGEFIGSNIRYVVHDEATGVSQYRHEYHNCKMTLDNTNNTDWDAKQCIGGGLGQSGTVIIDGGVYNSIGIEEQDDKGTITYHNPDHGTSAYFNNLVIVKNAFFETGTCYVSCLGDDTTEDATLFICNGCSMRHEPFANGLDNPYVNHNVTIRKWNNEIRLN